MNVNIVTSKSNNFVKYLNPKSTNEKRKERLRKFLCPNKMQESVNPTTKLFVTEPNSFAETPNFTRDNSKMSFHPEEISRHDS